jgi:putative transposase
MKYALIRAHRGAFPVSLMCQTLKVGSSEFYAWLNRSENPRNEENRRLLIEIKAIHSKSRKTYGSPRIHAELNESGHACIRYRVARLMCQHGIVSKHKRKFRVTTNFVHYRKIIGWAMDRWITRQLAIDALNMAIKNGCLESGLLHHSARGVQYASNEFRGLLKTHAIQCSMSRKGNCWDKAVAESFFHTLKVELVQEKIYHTRQEAKTDIFNYIEIFYNRQRRHSYLGYLNPVDFDKKNAA